MREALLRNVLRHGLANKLAHLSLAYALDLRQSHKGEFDCHITKQKRRDKPVFFVLVDTARVELASENHLIQISP